MREFQYNENVLSSCVAGNENDCAEIFHQHQSHYQRTYSNGLDSRNIASQRYRKFKENAEFIHRFNLKKHSHHAALNQFSDLLDNELPLYEVSENYINKTLLEYEDPYLNVIPIETQDDLEKLLSTRSRSLHHNKKRKQKNTHHNFYLDKDDPFAELDASNDGTYSIDISEEAAYVEFNKDQDDFSTFLNWATSSNPDGVPLVHPAEDQGSCGSCWAFATIGSVEAIASRRIGLRVYQTELNKYSTQNGLSRNSTVDYLEALQYAIQSAQHAESRVFDVTHLSIQELVDCDTKYDQGCTGGNPVMAFPYIHKWGLVSRDDYPYIGFKQKCNKQRRKNPIAYTQSWGLIKAKDEQYMKTMLRNFGPISVGINGSDKSFLHYKGGIYENASCKMRPNHAMLIVGYGEEIDEYGLKRLYWIARNSWGGYWGEQGFMRVRRMDEKHNNGVCGISRNPSIALGASFLGSQKFIQSWTQKTKLELIKSTNLSATPVPVGHYSLVGSASAKAEKDVENKKRLFCSNFFIGVVLVVLLLKIVTKKRNRIGNRIESGQSMDISDGVQPYGSCGAFKQGSSFAKLYD